jgi:hypothetical protein
VESTPEPATSNDLPYESPGEFSDPPVETINKDESVASFLEELLKSGGTLNTEHEHKDKHFPYRSLAMMLLRFWQLKGEPVSDRKMNDLLRLICLLVSQFGADPSVFPRNLDDILECEHDFVELVSNYQ